MIKLKKILSSLLLIAAISLVSCHQNSDADLLKKITSNSINLLPNIILTVSNNQVYLDGLVESDSTSLAIENYFKSMQGVVSVKNNLKVIPGLRKDSHI